MANEAALKRMTDMWAKEREIRFKLESELLTANSNLRSALEAYNITKKERDDLLSAVMALAKSF